MPAGLPGMRGPFLRIGDDHALEVRQPGVAVAGQPGEVLRPRVVELERPPAVVGDLSRVRNVPDLALDVIVPPVHPLAQAVIEAAEVPAALAVHPAQVLDLVPADRALGIGQAERPGPQSPPPLLHLQVLPHTRPPPPAPAHPYA